MRRTKATIVLLFLFIGSASDAGDLQKENSHFIIHYAAGDERIAINLDQETPAIRERIVADLGVDFPEKIEIRLCSTLEDFRDAQPGRNRVPLWAVGVAYPHKNVIVLLSPRAVKGRRIDVIAVFAHEFSHIAVGRALIGVAVPVWLDEGLAIYEAREWNFSRIAVLTQASLMNRLIPLTVLTRSFPGEEEAAELAYAESFMFISFLINKMGREAFHRLISDYTRYGDLDGAFRRSMATPLRDLERQWLVYLKLRVSWIPIIMSVSTVWFLATLIFIYGYFRKRRQAERRLKEMVAEEEGLERIWH